MDVMINNSFKLSEIDVIVQDFLVSSIDKEVYSKRIEGNNRTLDFGADDTKRSITVPFYFYPKYIYDVGLIRDEIFDKVTGNQAFWIREMRDNGTGNELFSGKQYQVRLKDVIEVDQTYKLGQGVMKFETVELPYGISVATTQTIQVKGLFNDDSWSYGMGLETVDDSELKYNFTGKTFRVFNAGNVEIHPFESYLKIIMSSIQATSDRVSLANRTNNSRIDINRKPLSSETWQFDGPVITCNSLNSTKDTSKKFISLVPGWNQIELEGATSANASFDFNFLYR